MVVVKCSEGRGSVNRTGWRGGPALNGSTRISRTTRMDKGLEEKFPSFLLLDRNPFGQEFFAQSALMAVHFRPDGVFFLKKVFAKIL